MQKKSKCEHNNTHIPLVVLVADYGSNPLADPSSGL